MRLKFAPVALFALSVALTAGVRITSASNLGAMPSGEAFPAANSRSPAPMCVLTDGESDAAPET